MAETARPVARRCEWPGCKNPLPAEASGHQRYCDDVECKKGRQRQWAREYTARKRAETTAAPAEGADEHSPPPAELSPVQRIQRLPRECPVCQETKAIEEFGAYDSADGHDFMCSGCREQLEEKRLAAGAATPEKKPRGLAKYMLPGKGLCTCGRFGSLFRISTERVGCIVCFQAARRARVPDPEE